MIDSSLNIGCRNGSGAEGSRRDCFRSSGGHLIRPWPLTFHPRVEVLAVAAPLIVDLGSRDVSFLGHAVQLSPANLRLCGQFLYGQSLVSIHSKPLLGLRLRHKTIIYLNKTHIPCQTKTRAAFSDPPFRHFPTVSGRYPSDRAIGPISGFTPSMVSGGSVGRVGRRSRAGRAKPTYRLDCKEVKNRRHLGLKRRFSCVKIQL